MAGRVILPGATFCGVGRAGVVFTTDGVVAAFFSASLRRSSSPRMVGRVVVGRGAASGKGPMIGLG